MARWRFALATVAIVAVTLVVAWEVVGDGGPERALAGDASPATTTTAPPPVHELSLLFAGDVLVHEPVAAAARTPAGYDFRPLFARVRPIVEAADVAICHLEIPVDDDNADISSYPLFYAPRQLPRALADTGFDGCSTASNHSIDQGPEGVRTTLAALDAVGLRHAGTGRTAAESRRAAIYRVDGVKVAHLSFSYGTNGIPLPSGAPWSVDLIDPARIIRRAKEARRAGAEVVVVSLHWGVEYNQAATPEQLQLARAIGRSGTVDLIVGHHAHVPQPIDKIAGHWVVFGLGNFVSNQSSACCHVAAQDGVMVRAELRLVEGRRAEVVRLVYTPIRVDRAGYVVTPVAEALRDPARRGTLTVAELHDSFARTAAVVAGTPRPRVVPSAVP